MLDYDYTLGFGGRGQRNNMAFQEIQYLVWNKQIDIILTQSYDEW